MSFLYRTLLYSVSLYQTFRPLNIRFRFPDNEFNEFRKCYYLLENYICVVFYASIPLDFFFFSDLDDRVTKGDHVKLQLSSKDKMFAKIRAQHFTNIFTSLSSYAKQLKMQQAKAANMSINEMKSFVQKELKEMQNQSKAVALHIGKSNLISCATSIVS